MTGNPSLEIQLIAVLVAIACALPGTFLVLRRVAMMSDAISHAILFGIVIAFLFTGDLNSPWLVAGAALTGVLTVWLVELLQHTRLVREDAAIGLVFPVLFSIGVILIARHAGSVHLDTDAVLLGDLAFAPFDRLVVNGFDWGPRSAWNMAVILLLNVAFLVVCYKELKLATFDPGLAAALGLAPTALHYALMTLVSVTAVGAFDAVGSVLVVALMIAPPAAAYLLTDRLAVMLPLAAGLGSVSALGGYWLARWLDASIAGSMATMAGVMFALTLLLAPERGLLAQMAHRREQRLRFRLQLLLVHLLQHAGAAEADEELRAATLHEHLHWPRPLLDRVLGSALDRGLVARTNGHLALTATARPLAEHALTGQPIDW